MTSMRWVVVMLALGGIVSVAAAGEQWVFLGTYTSPDGSQGIYRCKFDDTTGQLSKPELAAEMASPSFLAIHPTKKFLYAVGEGSGRDGGPVVAFALNAKTGQLTKLNEDKSGGPGPCHIAISPQGNMAAIANYGGGSTCVFAIEADGKLGRRIGFVQHKGSSAHPSRQKQPHAHCCAFNAAGDHLYTVDLGIDKVKVFHVSIKNGLEEDEDEDVTLPPGTGPRHMTFLPSGQGGFYVCGELNSTVNVVQGGKVVQTLSTLPKETPGNTTAECITSPDGQFVYVSNRGHNSIAVFRVKDNRQLEPAGHITGDINIPRNFNIDLTGKWMLIASQNGGKVGVWERDLKTGGAKETGQTVAISRCVCVKFVPVEK
ncbi:MAG: lactonase family protein [Gemmataceae bacterium]|nr:lactonase family protein [Gemmata sp.]MDW8197793.1 lactonase family protein [Gemmataceae bacterium]